MTRLVPFVIAVLMLATQSAAQDHIAHGASGLAHGIPDFCAQATERLVVPAGQTRTLTGRFETSCLGVHGTVIIASNTTVRVDELVIYADGALLVGTADQPAIGVEIIIRDRPLNLAADPEQFGQGIIGLGRFALYGQPNASPRTVSIRSENPLGTRGHVILTQRADIDVRYVAFLDMGRTSASRPLDSTTFSGQIATHTGSNQIGRYSLHLHHVMGPLPAKTRQFTLIGNVIERDSKWGVAIHNSHFGLIQNNRCVQPAGVCYVEEDGSETDNHWIGNYAGQGTGTPCRVIDYDPEGRCPAGFWLRAINNVVRDNVVEDLQRGIAWWTACLEVGRGDPSKCGPEPVTIPKFPGADTTDPTQIEICFGRDGSPGGSCSPGHRAGLVVDGNTIRRGESGIEFWWTSRQRQNRNPLVTPNTPVITNTRTENVAKPIRLHYSDIVVDGFTATGCQLFMEQFNDSSVNFGAFETTVNRATATCSDAIFGRIGQLHLGPAYKFTNSTFTSLNGIHIRYGGQRVVGYPVSTVKVEDSIFSGPIFTTSAQTYDLMPGQQVVMSATRVNGQTFTQTLPEGSTPGAPPQIPTPQPAPGTQPNPSPTAPTVPNRPCRFPPETGLCR